MSKTYNLSVKEKNVLAIIRKVATVNGSNKGEYNVNQITAQSLKRSGFRKAEIRTFQHAHWHQAEISKDDKAIIEKVKQVLPELTQVKAKRQGGKTKRSMQKKLKHHPQLAEMGNNEYPRPPSEEFLSLNEEFQTTRDQSTTVVELPEKSEEKTANAA